MNSRERVRDVTREKDRLTLPFGWWKGPPAPPYSPLCRGLAPRGAKGHGAAVPCLPLGCGDPSQGLDTVCMNVAGDMADDVGWGAWGLDPSGQAPGLFRGWAGKVGETQPGSVAR